jgi:hypothetical protein
MATIWCEKELSVPAERAWAALRRVDMAHSLFSPVLVDCAMDGDIRTVTFANGLIVCERIITVDEQRRRVAYSVIGGRFEIHASSMSILPINEKTCRFVWISDFLPDDRAGTVQALVEQGSSALVRNIEARSAPG